MANRIDDYFRFQETALSVRGQRQQLISSNIANADTPNYKARDIDFSSAMNNALNNATTATSTGVAVNQNGNLASNAMRQTGNQSPTELAKTSPNHLDGQNSAGGSQLLYRNPSQSNIDGNTVDMDVERNQFADNSLRYEASLTMINMQIRGMLAAIQG